jgi:hypothetical protein
MSKSLTAGEHDHERDRVAETRIRGGRSEDIPAIARLMHRAADGIPHVDAHELEAVAAHGQLIVLQLRPGELAAAACVVAGRGLVFLVVDPEVVSSRLEHRMISVADALCESERGAPLVPSSEAARATLPAAPERAGRDAATPVMLR